MRVWTLGLLLWACSSADKEDTSAVDTGPVDTADTGSTTSGLAWPGAVWDEGAPGDYGFDADALADAIEYALGTGTNTQAVVIIKDGVLVGEGYASDCDQDTPVTSWSVAKSVMSALYGVALREKALNLDDPVGAHLVEWSGATYDGITLRHLLTMQSGLEANDSNPYGVYGSGDQLTYSLDRTPSWAPGNWFNYVNEDSMVLGGVLSQAFGKEVGEVAQAEIFEPLGLEATWWSDTAGSSLSYCCIDSTARDMARFGLLYSRGGEWDGTQIVPAAFVDESTSGASYHGYYGMQWWVLDDDVFAAIGVSGQYIYVYPEQDLVVVRFGRYWQVGDEAVRDAAWNNYHYTLDEGTFNEGHFRDLVQAALAD